MHKGIAVLLAAILITLSGCGGIKTADENAQKEEQETQPDAFLGEAVYDFSYEKPKKNPNILVNRNGFGEKDTKVAFFCGKELQEDFRLIDKTTRKVVFEGKLENMDFQAELGVYVAKGDFSEVTAKGSYYLEADIIGQSYPFEIGENTYETIYNNVIESIYYHRCGTNLNGKIEVNNHAACHTGKTYLKNSQVQIDTVGGWHTDNNFNKDVVESTKMVSDLLLTYEFLHGNIADGTKLTDEVRSLHSLIVEAAYEINFLLKLQDEQTGAFYAGVKSDAPLNGSEPQKDTRAFYVEEISDEATAECAGVLAQFSRVYRAIDEELADKCQIASEKAYTYLDGRQMVDDLQYYAACELYKTTGNPQYSQYILKYTKDVAPKYNSRFDRELYGNIAYLTTTYKVDLEFCTTLMDEFMNRAEVISQKSKEDTYLVCTRDGKRKSEDVLESTFILAIVDHIVTSHEYLGIIENQLQYLFGRNELGANMVTNKGILRQAKEEEEYDLYLQSTLIFVLHELIEREAN